MTARISAGRCPDCAGALGKDEGTAAFCKLCKQSIPRGQWLTTANASGKSVSPTPIGGSAGETKPASFVTAAELATRTPAEVPWLIKPFVAKGAKTLISGKPKAAGKTTFALRLIRSVITGEPFLRTVPELTGPVVLLSEEGDATLMQALMRAGLRDSSDLHILQPYLGMTWQEVAGAAIAEVRREGAVLLAIDTMPVWAQIPGDSENSAGVAQELWQPFTGLNDVAMLALFHDRKSGGEPGDSTRGSSAFAGAVDIIIDIRRVGGNGRERWRELAMLGRFDLPDKLIVELGDDGYELLGEAGVVRQRDNEQAVLDVIDDVPRTEEEVKERVPSIAKTALNSTLRSLIATGTVTRQGSGKKGDPYRYVSPTLQLYSAGETNNGHKPGHLAQTASDLTAVGGEPS